MLYNLTAAKQAGRKHRNYGNARASNPYPNSDPCRKAWFAGWDERHHELGSHVDFGYTTSFVAKRLGRKHRNYGNPLNVNPYHPSDPCWQAWRKGWLERDAELKRKGK